MLAKPFVRHAEMNLDAIAGHSDPMSRVRQILNAAHEIVVDGVWGHRILTKHSGHELLRCFFQPSLGWPTRHELIHRQHREQHEDDPAKRKSARSS